MEIKLDDVILALEFVNSGIDCEADDDIANW